MPESFQSSTAADGSMVGSGVAKGDLTQRRGVAGPGGASNTLPLLRVTDAGTARRKPFTVFSIQELFSVKFYQALAAEFIGMFLFLSATITAIVFTFPVTIAAGGGAATAPVLIPRWMLIAFVFGLMIAVLVFSIAHISGGHLNPAVSLALLLRGNITLLRFVAYVLIQMCGACFGAAYAKWLNPSLFNTAGGGVNAINYALAPGMNTWTALGAEMFATAILCWVVLSSSDVGREHSTKRHGAIAPLAIGFAVFVDHLALIPIDGCSINPARSFGASAVKGAWPNHWIFWVGPWLGAVFATVLYAVASVITATNKEAQTIAAGATVPEVPVFSGAAPGVAGRGMVTADGHLVGVAPVGHGGRRASRTRPGTRRGTAADQGPCTDATTHAHDGWWRREQSGAYG